MKKKNNIIKIIVCILLMILLSIGTIFDEKQIYLKILYIIKNFFMSSSLVIIFSNIGKTDFRNKKNLKRIYILYILFGITFLVINTIESGFFKIINIFPLISIGVSIVGILRSKSEIKTKKLNAFKLGVIFILSTLMIPLVLILSIKGY